MSNESKFTAAEYRTAAKVARRSIFGNPDLAKAWDQAADQVEATDSGMTLTTAQVKDVRIVLGLNGSQDIKVVLDAQERLRALFPATEPAVCEFRCEEGIVRAKVGVRCPACTAATRASEEVNGNIVAGGNSSPTVVHVHHRDIEAHAASFNEGYDEAMRQLAEPVDTIRNFPRCGHYLDEARCTRRIHDGDHEVVQGDEVIVWPAGEPDPEPAEEEAEAEAVTRNWWGCTGCDWRTKGTYGSEPTTETATEHARHVVEQHNNGRTAELEARVDEWSAEYRKGIQARDNWRARAEKAEATIARVNKALEGVCDSCDYTDLRTALEEES